MSAIFLFLLHFFWPEPPIVVARETTYITEPLRPNGLPDYEKYILEQCRKGTTPDNNAGVLLWKAFWPNGLEREHYEPMRAELGLKEIPPASAALQLVYGDANKKRVLDWLRKQHLKVDEIDPYDWIGPATDSAWTSQQFPPLAEWVEANRQPLDLIVAASRRPRFYSPSPNMLDKQHDMLMMALLPDTQNMREAARGLSTRAMRHIGENRLNDAWSDLLAIHRLARLMAQGPTLVGQCVAMSLSDIACQGTVVLLGNKQLTAELAHEINKDLAGLPEFPGVISCVDSWERLSALDVVLHTKMHGLGSLWGDPPSSLDASKLMSFDWNVTLRRVNYWFDRVVAAAKLPTREARKRAYAKFGTDLPVDSERAKKRPIPLRLAFLSLEQRSRMIGDIVARIMMCTLDSDVLAKESHNTTLQLTRLAAAIAGYRAARGRYPEKLDELIPGALEKLPVDFYNAKPFLYQRLGEGYLLYSVGENGLDDGGSHQEWDILKGQSLDEHKNSDPEKMPPQIPAGADDISIRMPRPPFKLPKAIAAANQP